MRTIAIVNASAVNEYALEPFAGGPSSLERVSALAERLAGRDGVLVLASAEGLAPPGFAVLVREDWSMRAVFEAARDFAASRAEADALVYFQADAPFSDAGMAERLLALHRRYRAEYTYADGWPAGFAPEVLAPRSLANLAELASRNDGPVERDGIFSVIQKDINSYDIETELSPVDLRGLRFSPTCDTRRNRIAAERLWHLGVRSAEEASRLLPGRPDLLRTVPAFLWVQVAGGCPQACSYCPYPSMAGDPLAAGGFMTAERFRSLMSQAEALCDDLVVDLSLWGEPALHPDFEELAEAALARPRFSLIVETSGIGWKPGLPERVAGRGGPRVHWIVSLDDPDEAGYRSLRGEGRAEAEAFAARMAAAFPGQVHAQAVRMKDNEARLEAFYRSWKKTAGKVIVQKYDSFAGCLPDRTVADLAPLDRFPCRHLARDLSVLLDGTVPACKHCLVRGPDGRLSYARTLGNAFDDGLETVWERAGDWYARHGEGDYPEPCGRCDEYHTFNA